MKNLIWIAIIGAIIYFVFFRKGETEQDYTELPD